jgi:hypothetical protein
MEIFLTSNYIKFQQMLEKGCLGMGERDEELTKLVYSAAAALAGKPMDLRSSVLFILDSSNQSFSEKAEFARRLAVFMQEEKWSPIAQSDQESSDGTQLFSSCPSGTTPRVVVVAKDCLSS